MDILLFGGTLCAGLFAGLTLKKHGVHVIPQSMSILQTNREYYEQMQKDMEKSDY
jgi:hypothetical protein